MSHATNPEELYAQALEEFQARNSLIYGVVYPSLIIDGPHEDDDLETIRNVICKGALKDGIGLLAWALQWTDLDSFET